MLVYRRYFFLILISFCYLFCFSQLTEINDELPRIVGQKGEWDYFLDNHLIFPEKLLNQKKDFLVKVYVTISDKGLLYSYNFPDFVDTELQAESIRLIKLLKWEPAKKNGLSVLAKKELLIDFNVERYKKAVKKRGFSRTKTDKKNPIDTGFAIISNPDYLPEYFNGENALNEFISDNLEFPDEAKRHNIQGIVILSFVVETNGKVSNLKIEKTPGFGYDEVASDLIRQTRWKPAIHKGKFVRSEFQYSINFSLNDNFRSNEMSEQK
ncbi:MAG: energy transducer TonB [Bacteroidota bacterium]